MPRRAKFRREARCWRTGKALKGHFCAAGAPCFAPHLSAETEQFTAQNPRPQGGAKSATERVLGSNRCGRGRRSGRGLPAGRSVARGSEGTTVFYAEKRAPALLREGA